MLQSLTRHSHLGPIFSKSRSESDLPTEGEVSAEARVRAWRCLPPRAQGTGWLVVGSSERRDYCTPLAEAQRGVELKPRDSRGNCGVPGPALESPTADGVAVALGCGPGFSDGKTR